jgi:integrative and conjugative element protein (TIGR02256 family)
VGTGSSRPPTLPDVWQLVSYSVDIRPEAAARISDLAGASADGVETGGILLGRGPDANGVIVVEDAGDAGPKADRRPDFFLRDLAHAQRLAAEAWERDKAIWVGEWHTHPKGPIQPSPRDLSTYVALMTDTALEFKAFVSIIVIPDPDWSSPRLLPWVLAPAAPAPPDPPRPK